MLLTNEIPRELSRSMELYDKTEMYMTKQTYILWKLTIRAVH